MQVEEQSQSQEATADLGDGSLDGAAAAFMQREEPQEEATEQDEQATEVDATEAEPAEGDPTEEAEASDEFATVEFDGVTLTVPADKAEEVKKGLLRQADYSRKMNEVSDKAKEYASKAEQAQKLAENAEAYAEVLAEVRLVDQQLKQYESLDWQTLRRENPAEFAALAAEFQGLKLSKKDIVSKAQTKAREIEDAKAQGINEKRAAMFKVLEKDLPGWGDALGQQITQYAVQSGWTVENLTQLTDPQVVIALDKARKFDNIQNGKAEALKKAQGAPKVMKPGAAKPRTDVRTDSLARLKQSGAMQDAEAAFLARMK